MNDWWWQVITDFYTRVSASKYHGPDDPPPYDFAVGMLALIERIRGTKELAGVRPGLHRRVLTLRPPMSTQKIGIKWIATDLFEIEMETASTLFDIPWDGKIVVPGDVVIQAILNCKRVLEASPN